MVELIIYTVLCIVLGFSLTSRGLIFTEKVKNILSIITLIFGGSLIFLSIFYKVWTFAIFSVVGYLLFTNVGQVIALLAMREGRRASKFSWLMFILASLALAYFLIFARVAIIE